MSYEAKHSIQPDATADSNSASISSSSDRPFQDISFDYRRSGNVRMATKSIYDVAIVNLSGTLNSHSAGDIVDRLMRIAQVPGNKVVLDVEKLEQLSNAGLRVILRMAKLLRSMKGEMVICSTRPVISEILQDAGYNSLLKLYGSEKDAVAAVI